MNRRTFLGSLSIVAPLLPLLPRLGRFRARDPEQREMRYRTLGRTGERVSLLGLGGAHLGMQRDERESIRIIRRAIDQGVNFLDNSWDYHDGESERRMGKALKEGYRKRVFLMTKVDGRTRGAAARQIDESLARLSTDCIDLLQLHEIIRMSDVDRIFAPGGAMEALLLAKQAGKIRYVGFTGHKSPVIHRAMLEAAFRNGLRFDAVQMPLNVLDAHHDSFEKQVLPILVRHEIGVLGMKALGDGHILESGAVSAVECLRYAMSLPTSTVITGCDSMAVLMQGLEVARNFEPMSTEERAALLARTKDVAAFGRYELYKSTQRFDATTRHPEWLG